MADDEKDEKSMAAPEGPKQAVEVAVPEGKMYVKVYAPFKVYYDDLAESVTARNDTGEFDILAGHHNFMTLVSTCDITIRNGEKEEKITVIRGVMHVKKDRIVVFLDV